MLFCFPTFRGKYKGQNMRIVAKAYGCYVLDTIVSITSKMALPIQRSPENVWAYSILYCR